jgi:ABC-type uncharacterized transport system substrate-binding protein
MERKPVTLSPFRRALVAAAFCSGLMTAAPASAHPHLWIDVSAAVVFNADKQVAAIEARWKFDELYSVFATEGMQKDANGGYSKETLAGLAAENVKQLKEWHYFTVVESGGKRAPLAPVTEYAMTWGDGRLTLEMTLRLSKPLDPTAKPVRFAFFDPTYYIDLVFAREEGLRLSGPPARCRARVDVPDTAGGTFVADEIANAMRPDPNKPQESLGARFAEWVSLDCPAGKP